MENETLQGKIDRIESFLKAVISEQTKTPSVSDFGKGCDKGAVAGIQKILEILKD